MELRVWVDGTQRVVCGVKLTTTCQEIVFALAHATQQAGRFTMIERWRNNERLLSPNEQPLVTLQRWGDHMNEVEFILRKTSTDIPAAAPPAASTNTVAATTTTTSTVNHLKSPPQNTMATRLPQNAAFRNSSSNLPLNTSATSSTNANNNNNNNSNINTSMTASPSTNNNPLRPTSSSMICQYVDDQVLGSNPTTLAPSGASSTSLLRLPHNGYPLYSETTTTQLQQHQQSSQQQISQEAQQVSKNYPYEELYSTINRKRSNNQPPAVPAKPRVVSQILSGSNYSQLQPPMQPVNNAQINYYHHPNQGSPLHMFPNNLRPMYPPGYSDFMEARNNRNPMVQPTLISNSNFAQQNQHAQSNMYPQRSFDLSHQPQMYPPPHNMQQQQSRSSPNDSLANTRYRYSSNGQLNRLSYGNQSHDLGHFGGSVQPTSMHQGQQQQQFNSLHPKLAEPSLIINRGSAVNVKLHPSNSHNSSLSSQLPHLNSSDRTASNSSLHPTSNNNNDSASSVSQMGHDMLKVIEEQKKVLMNQKDELNRLDNDQEYWESKQNSEQVELINRIENEIRQLEELWKENQTQIQKLENQDFEKELQVLKSEQAKMELEISKQKNKLVRCEKDIVLCKNKIEQLEAEIAQQEESDSDESSASSSSSTSSSTSSDDGEQNSGELYMDFIKKTSSNNNNNNINNNVSKEPIKSLDVEDEQKFKPVLLDMHANNNNNSNNNNKGLTIPNGKQTNGKMTTANKNSEDDEDFDDDESGGDASDDLNVSSSDNSKLRSAKDVAYVDKRGLISGIRSLKLDKSRALNRQLETIRSTENINVVSANNSPNGKEKITSSTTAIISNNNTTPTSNDLEKRCPETNGHSDTANNKYEFLMTL